MHEREREREREGRRRGGGEQNAVCIACGCRLDLKSPFTCFSKLSPPPPRPNERRVKISSFTVNLPELLYLYCWKTVSPSLLFTQNCCILKFGP